MSEAIKPPEQRPEHPDFWCKRFGEGVTPWDAGKVPAALADFIARQKTPLNTLIPGCGSGWPRWDWQSMARPPPMKPAEPACGRCGNASSAP